MLQYSCGCIAKVNKSIDHYELPISKSAFIGKSKLIPYLRLLYRFIADRSEEDTQLAVDSGIPAAMLYAEPTEDNVLLQQDEKIRISFDGDAVLLVMKVSSFTKQKV